MSQPNTCTRCNAVMPSHRVCNLCESLVTAAKEMVDVLIEKEIPQWPEIEAARKRLQSVLGYDGPSDA